MVDHRGELHTFWNKLVFDVLSTPNIPMLIVKENARVPLVVTNTIGKSVMFSNTEPLAESWHLDAYVHTLQALLRLPYSHVVAALQNYKQGWRAEDDMAHH